RKLIDQPTRRHALQDYPLGPLLGQCCGGHVRLLVERLDAASLPWLDDAARACAAGAPFRLQARFAEGAIQRSVQPASADVPSDSPRTPLAEVRSLAEAITPKRPRLVIFGAGHVGQAVARAFAPLPFHLDWLASREDLRPEAGGTQATIMDEDELQACVEAAPPDAFFAIFTHSHDLDYRLTRAVLARGDFRYLGLIGSATKRVRFERRLRDDGVTDADLARLTCPIGIPALKSKAPAVIAVSLAAELLQLVEDAA
ncbi:MAG: Xanthine dehydrogenase accessory protein XdhC, partial [Caulobacteraceae bacterium]|nr:Xanthine dehydrogenase accessory protein XdhC [Caulobacteraceae bacterium]